MPIEVETLLKNVVPGMAEGPFWEEETQSLLFVDLTAPGGVYRWHSLTNKLDKISFDTNTPFIIPHSKGGYVAGVNKSVVHFQWDAHKDWVLLAEIEAGLPTRLNDAKCDPRGRLFVGTMPTATISTKTLGRGQGSLHRIDSDGTSTRCRDKFTLSNGLAWSPDEKTMYFVDTIPGYVFAYDYDVTTGDISNERIVLDMSKDKNPISGRQLLPDGMTTDADGNLWIAVIEGCNVIQVNPNTGKILQEVSIPARHITSCCFGGENYDELFVTSGLYGITVKDDPFGGSVFRIKDLGCRGMPGRKYEGI